MSLSALASPVGVRLSAVARTRALTTAVSLDRVIFFSVVMLVSPKFGVDDASERDEPTRDAFREIETQKNLSDNRRGRSRAIPGKFHFESASTTDRVGTESLAENRVTVEFRLFLMLTVPLAVFVYICWSIGQYGARYWVASTGLLWVAGVLGSMDAPLARQIGICAGSGVAILLLMGCVEFSGRRVPAWLTFAVWSIPALAFFGAQIFGMNAAYIGVLMTDAFAGIASVSVLLKTSRERTSMPEGLLPLVIAVLVPLNALDSLNRVRGAETIETVFALAGLAIALSFLQVMSLIDRVLASERRARAEVEIKVEERTRELEESRDRLRHSERLASIGTFAAGIAHQINNPLGAIVMASDFARQSRESEEEVEVAREAIDTIREQAERCGRVVRKILSFARDEPTARSRFDLDSLVRSAIERTAVYAADHKASIQSIGEAGPVWIWANATEIEEAFVNMLRNAIESKDSGARVLVRIATEPCEAVIEIEDDGRGIPGPALAHVIDPFFTSRLDRGGSGLGLSVVHGTVKTHGGTLEIDSTPDVGTRLRITLPLSIDD